MVSGVLAFRDGVRYWFPMVAPTDGELERIRHELLNPPARVVDLFWIDDIESEYAQGILQSRGFSQ